MQRRLAGLHPGIRGGGGSYGAVYVGGGYGGDGGGYYGGGAIYTDSQYVNQANTQQLDSWTRIDAGARYATKIEGRPTTFRATVQNVFDREYWSGVASYGAFSQGSPRTLLLSTTVDF